MTTHKFAVGGLVSRVRHPLSLPATLIQDPAATAGDTLEVTFAAGAMAQMTEAFPDLTCIVFYEAPWYAFDDLVARDPARFLADPVAAITLWLNYYKAILRLRHTLGPRLILLNATHTGAIPLRDYLQQQYAVDLPLNAAELVSGERLPPTDTALSSSLAFALGKVFELVTPECHELYEALESCALLLGREPEFRQVSSQPPANCLEAVLTRWVQTHKADIVQAELVARNQTQAKALAALETELAQVNLALQTAQTAHVNVQQQIKSVQTSTSQALDAAQLEVANLRQQQQLTQQEANQTMLQLHQAQAELEHYLLAQQKLTQALACAHNEAKRTQEKNDLASQAHTASEASTAATIAALQGTCASMVTKNSTISQELQQQRTHAESLTEQLINKGTDMARLVQELAAAHNELECLKSALLQEQDMSDDILLRLHETQEHLEINHLENQSMQQLLIQAQASFVRARHVLARFMGAQATVTPVCGAQHGMRP